MSERGLIHIAGPEGSGKTAFVEALLQADIATSPSVCAACVRRGARRRRAAGAFLEDAARLEPDEEFFKDCQIFGEKAIEGGWGLWKGYVRQARRRILRAFFRDGNGIYMASYVHSSVLDANRQGRRPQFITS